MRLTDELPTLRVVVWDLWQTLADGQTRPSDFYRTHFKGLCLFDEETFLDRLRNSDVFLKDSPIEDTLPSFLSSIGQSNAPIDQAVAYWKRMADEVYVYSGARTLLQAVKKNGTQLALLTNSDKYGCENTRISPLLDEFDFRYLSYEMGRAKPDPLCWKAIASYFGVPYSQMMMVGDSFASDIAPAQALGMKTMHITDGATEIPRLAEDLNPPLPRH